MGRLSAVGAGRGIPGEISGTAFRTRSPLSPAKIAKIEYQMPDIFHTFRKGHRIMVQVQSSWFPLVDRNPQQFVDIYNAKETIS